MKKRTLSLLLALLMIFSVSAYASEIPSDTSPFTRTRSYEGSFADVKQTDWFASAVVSAYEYGLVEGRGNGFAPSENITVAELATLSARLHSTYTADEYVFSAEAGAEWYEPYVSYLRESALFPEDITDVTAAATRAQMAAIFALSLPDEWYDDRNADIITDLYTAQDFITDVSDVTPYQSQILWMYAQGLLAGMDKVGSFQPDKNVTRAEIATLLTRIVEPETRLSADAIVMQAHSVADATLFSIVSAPATASTAPDWTDSAAVDACVRKMLAAGENKLSLKYPSLSKANAEAIVNAFVSSVKTYCEQMYNQVEIKYYSSGRAYLSFSSTACTDAQLPSYRSRTLAKAIEIHDMLWADGYLTYDMSELEIAKTYYVWLCENCRYDNTATTDDASLSHLAYNTLINGSAVCDGYTGAYNLLLKLEGIECSAKFNDTHIWTVATLDGTQYHIDTTWGDQYSRIDMSCFAMDETASYAKHAW